MTGGTDVDTNVHLERPQAYVIDFSAGDRDYQEYTGAEAIRHDGSE